MSFKKSAFIVLIVTALLTAMLPSYAQRLALVIGNSAYRGIGFLSNPVNDAKDLARVLYRLGFEVTLRQNLNQEQMETVIDQFGEKLSISKGVGLFYFSGYGAQHDGENYLIPSGVPQALSARQLRYKTVAVSYVLETMKAANNEINLIFLDACRSYPKNYWFKGEKIVSGLAPMLTAQGALISYATNPGNVVINDKGRNSPYVKHLMKWIKKPYLSINQVLRKVRLAVIKETHNIQSPGYYDELNDDFYFFRQQNDFTPGIVFRDRLQEGSLGPEMVWIPAGTFRMGDIQGGGESDEKPVHSVSVNRFAMGKYEVTVGEYLRFVQLTGSHAPEWQKKGSQYNIKTGINNYYKKFGSALTNENHPIVGITWYDAVAYTEWLSRQTGQQYRLPTEAEWEYAARAGTETKYWWGNDIGINRANCDNCGSQWDDKQTAPVGSFQPNPFGLYDTVGNVWEWTCSEYEDKYNGKEKQCFNRIYPHYRVLRGGSWNLYPNNCRAAKRSWYIPDVVRSDYSGFRLIRRVARIY
jgi:formylglycine-generating enzyme required for sulfatase activity